MFSFLIMKEKVHMREYKLRPLITHCVGKHRKGTTSMMRVKRSLNGVPPELYCLALKAQPLYQASVVFNHPIFMSHETFQPKINK